MSPPRASVVIGVYNRAAQLEACLASLLASTFHDFELVIVEDASTDDSAAVLERFRRAHPGASLRIIHNARNRGASGARNVGIAAAAGEYLLFTDSDCVVDPSWIEAMVNGFERTGAAAISGTVLDKAPSNLAERAYVGSCLIAHKDPNLMECNMGLRRSLGYRFDDAIFNGEGDDLALRMRQAGHAIAFVPDAVVHHHHALSFRHYMRMARNTGRGHSLYWYKHDRFLGRDILAGGLAVLSLPLALLDARLLAVPAMLAALQLAAILFNEVRYKRKSVLDAVSVLPVAIPYYAMRTVSALATKLRIVFGRERAIRASKREWYATRRAP